MITIYHKTAEGISKERDRNMLKQIEQHNILWIDLFRPDEEEKNLVSSRFKVDLQNEEQIEEIESSSRFYETNDLIIANSKFLLLQNEGFTSKAVSFILKENLLISFRNAELRSFIEINKKMDHNFRTLPTGYHILVALFEIRIDLDADLLESIARDISKIGKQLRAAHDSMEDSLLRISVFQETTMLLRENIVDKQRVVSAMLKSEHFPPDCNARLRIIIKDISSLLDHTAFSFERLEYLQNTFLGLINIEQNKIIKIFTVVSVIFMPPTLIASLYGMNFDSMPELHWDIGYPFAILLMIISSLATLMLFKKKHWL
jgi:magnesium transporter